MKKILSILLILIIFSGISSAEVKFSQDLYKRLSKSKNEKPKIDIPEYEKITLNNGMNVYMAESHDLPIIEVTGYIKGGITQETKDKAGITSFMFQLMNKGTKNFTEEKLQEYKNIHGLSFGLSVKRDYFKFSGNALSSDKDHLFKLMSEILRKPKFDRKYHKRVMMQRMKSFSQARTQEKSLRSLYYSKGIYGDHPYGYSSNIDLKTNALSKLNPKVLMNYYNKVIAPNVISIGIVGDFDKENMKSMIKKYFGDWKKKDIDIKKPEFKKVKNKKDIVLVNKPDSTQAKIKMGYKFKDYNFEQRIPFKMANKVYGSGDFQCRLTQNLRVDKGYVYAVYSRANHNEHGGDYFVSTEAKPKNTYKVLKNIKTEMLAIKNKKDKIKEKELGEIINLYNGIYPKFYKTKQDVLSEVIHNLEIREREADYINTYISEYNNLSAEKAQDSFEKYTYPDKFYTVIVGNKEDILPQLKEKGLDVKVVEIQ